MIKLFLQVIMLCISTVVSFSSLFPFVVFLILLWSLFCERILLYCCFFLTSSSSLASYHHCCFMYANIQGFSPLHAPPKASHRAPSPISHASHHQSWGWQLGVQEVFYKLLLHRKAIADAIFSSPEVTVT